MPAQRCRHRDGRTQLRQLKAGLLVAAAAAAAAAMEAARGSIETRQQQQPCAYTQSEQVSCCGATATSRST